MLSLFRADHKYIITCYLLVNKNKYTQHYIILNKFNIALIIRYKFITLYNVIHLRVCL